MIHVLVYWLLYFMLVYHKTEEKTFFSKWYKMEETESNEELSIENTEIQSLHQNCQSSNSNSEVRSCIWLFQQIQLRSFDFQANESNITDESSHQEIIPMLTLLTRSSEEIQVKKLLISWCKFPFLIWSSFQDETSNQLPSTLSVNEIEKEVVKSLYKEIDLRLNFVSFQNQTCSQKIKLFFPVVSWVLYHLDFGSDIWNAATFKLNCHMMYFACCVATIILSIGVTIIYVKLHFDFGWWESITYMRRFEYVHNITKSKLESLIKTHFFDREILFKHTKATVIAIYKRQPLPEMSKPDKEFVQKVSFIEAITEATAQLILSCLVLRSYGISSDTYSMVSQIFSMVMSLVSIVFAFGTVSFIRKVIWLLLSLSIMFFHRDKIT